MPTTEALFEVLKSIQSIYSTNNISLVFGCGGDRDKKDLMAKNCKIIL